jgi:tRNA modification GTPase
MSDTDTIAAIATPPGRGGVGIIRISGVDCQRIGGRILSQLPPHRHAQYQPFHALDGSVIDEGIAIYFPGPHSFTGEDVLELQAHGGPVILDMLLSECLQAGARLARPGEFSERAYLNDKLDLAQAEAIADLIDASSEQAARAAVRSLQGEFSKRINDLLTELIELRMYIEAAIDFPEEEVDFLADQQLQQRMQQLDQHLQALLQATQQGALLHEGMTVVIAGQPNAGKSSLLNALAGIDRAIVTHVPGTTRDVLHEHIQLNGLPVHIIDTAGLRQTDDEVEKIGIERAWTEIEKADRILLVIDDRDGLTDEDKHIQQQLPTGPGLTVVRNKCDLSGKPPSIQTEPVTEICLSAKFQQGLDLLRQHLMDCVGYQASGEGEFIARRRHLHALQKTAAHVAESYKQLTQAKAGELAAEELRTAQQHLSTITGEFSSDDLLGKIFSSFCIGK